MVKRIYLDQLREYHQKKIVLITGPRQTGKTTLSKWMTKNPDYLNHDNGEDASVIADKSRRTSIQCRLFII